MSNIIIGKHTLESLTTGMYSDPFVVYREYIQNSVDSIDNAYKAGCLTPGQELVTIEIQPSEGIVSVSDNGLGIPANEAEQVLISIGNSKKDVSLSRGFRGIGRLAALSYCNKLVFETSFPGESIGSRVIIDALKLTKILSIKVGKNDITTEDVLNTVCSYEQFHAVSTDHYFKVIMYDVDSSCGLMKLQLVKEYLEQVAPVPYNPSTFTWGREVLDRVAQYGYNIPEYCIRIKHGTDIFNLFKPYKDSFLVDKARNHYDSIQDIETHQLYDEKRRCAAIAWIAHSNYTGTVVDRSIKGIRIRKGNILIGDGQSLNTVFKDARFNGWIMGEVFVMSPALLPNARRDNFEKTSTYYLFSEQMTTIASGIVKQIRSASMLRNTKLAKAIKKAEAASIAANSILELPSVSPSKKGAVTQKINAAHKEISTIQPINSTEGLIQEIAFNELDMLIGKAPGITSYKSINLLNTLSKAEKKVLEKVFRVIQRQLPEEQTENIINAILVSFAENRS